MNDEGMRNRRSGVDIFEVIYKNDISQNYNGSGSPVLSSEYSANVTLSDSSSTDMIMSNCDLLCGLSIYAEPTKSKIIEYLCLAMDELSKIGIAGNPLWQRDTNHNCETLNHIEYWRQFGPVDATLREIVKLMEVGESQILPSFDMCQTQHQTSKTTPRGALTESSRDVAHVKMTPISIVELLMDVNQWSSAFYNIVSKATYVGALLGVEGSYNDRLHVMNAELHLPTTFVHTRECYFGRYSKQLTHNTWGVVDVSLEKFIPSSTSNFLKRPSGCLITEMSNGYSEVVWVEHVELEELQPQFTSTLAFGATRWLNSLVRYSEWSQTLKPTIFESDKGVVIPESGRASLIKLADRMMKMFCGNISSSISKQWTQIDGYSGCTDVRVMVKNNEDTMSLSATTVVFTTSLWLDVSPNRLFDFLRHEDSRTKWDALSHRLTIREFASMIKGENRGNRVSLMRANNSQGKLVIYYLQESYTDSTGSYVIYAPLDEVAISALSRGSDPDKVIILPSGFSILPGPLPGKEDGGTASFLTVAFHIVESTTIRPFISSQSIQTIYKIITDVVASIKNTVMYHSSQSTIG